MLIDAAVLAGGRSSRLGSANKASLQMAGLSLLEHAVSAALSISRTCVVVGPTDPLLHSDAVLFTTEYPPFSGPAAALAAGVNRLSSSSESESDAILILACDMPGIRVQLPLLAAALASAPADVDGAISVDANGYRQPLACLYRRHALLRAISQHADDGRAGDAALAGLSGLSMRALIEPLNLIPVAAVLKATDDVDTWEDAARLGATDPSANSSTQPRTNSRTDSRTDSRTETKAEAE